MTELEMRLFRAFPGASVNSIGEFIAHREANEYFALQNCKNDMDIKCKVLESLSRGAFKTLPFYSDKKNNEFHEFMLNGINDVLGTAFTPEEIEVVYAKLGNGINRELTVKFIESNYDIKVLKGETK